MGFPAKGNRNGTTAHDGHWDRIGRGAGCGGVRAGREPARGSARAAARLEHPDGHRLGHGHRGARRRKHRHPRLRVSALRPTASEALAAGAEALNLVRDALSEHGVADEDLQTVRIYLDEDFEYTAEERVGIGFRFSNTIRVIIDGVDTIGDIIDAAVGAGGDTVAINRIRFLVSNRVALEDTARLAAIDEACRKAAAMAERAGVHLGRVRVIEEIGHSTPVGVEEVLEENAADSEPTAAPIFGGDEQVTASVRIIFRIY